MVDGVDIANEHCAIISTVVLEEVDGKQALMEVVTMRPIGECYVNGVQITSDTVLPHVRKKL